MCALLFLIACSNRTKSALVCRSQAEYAALRFIAVSVVVTVAVAVTVAVLLLLGKEQAAYRSHSHEDDDDDDDDDDDEEEDVSVTRVAGREKKEITMPLYEER